MPSVLCGREANMDGFRPQPSVNLLENIRLININIENPSKILVWEDFAELDLYKFFPEEKIEKMSIEKEEAFAVLKSYIGNGMNGELILEYCDFEIDYSASPKMIIKRLLSWEEFGAIYKKISETQIKKKILETLPYTVKHDRVSIEIV